MEYPCSTTTSNPTSSTNPQKRKADSKSFSLYGSDDEEEMIANNEIETKKMHLSNVSDEKIDGTNAQSSNTELRNNTETSDVNKSDKGLLSVAAARKGEREDMQDRHIQIDDFRRQFDMKLLAGTQTDSQGVGDNRRLSFFALFDGHGGRRAADYCAENFVPKFVEVCRKNVNPAVTWERSIKKIFIETYKAIDDGFLNEARKCKPVLKDGTTATTLFLLDEILYCANIGDSKAVVCRYKEDKKAPMPMQLTLDHNPIVFEERMRIQKAGGTVKDGRVLGILEVSRSIGDGPIKSHGIICTPDVKKLTLTQNDLFIILACDGLWKSFTPESAVQFVWERFQQQESQNNSGDSDRREQANNDNTFWTSIADQLCADAIRLGCGDNVSVMIVLLQQPGQIRKLLKQ